jgi:hypothetical protein
MKHRLPLSCCVVLLAFLSACGGGGGGGGNGNINPGDVNALMAGIGAKVGQTNAVLQQGPLPTPSNNTAAPRAAAGVDEASAEPGDTVTVPVNVQSSSVLQRLCAKIGNASSTLCASLNGSPGAGSQLKLAKTKKQTAKAKAVTKQLESSSTLNFALTLPENLNDGSFCIDLVVEDVEDLVSNVEQVCIDVVSQIQQTANDQPTPAELPSDLAGEWRSPCIDEPGSDGSAKIGLRFGAQSSFDEFVELWSAENCAGVPEILDPFVSGSYLASNAQFNRQLRLWQLPFNFIPEDPEQLGLHTCFNVLRVSGNQLFLGIPATFVFDDAPDQPGSCVSAASRPDSIAPELPFTRDPTVGGQNQAPTAAAGNDRNLKLPFGSTIILDGSDSFDSDGQIVGFAWQQISGSAVTLQNANTAQASFSVPQGQAVLTFRLTVTDDDGATDTDDVVITLGGGGSGQVLAGPDQTVGAGEVVSLQGSTPGQSPLAVEWMQIEGPAVTLQAGNTFTPSFTAPAVNQGTVLLEFRLTATFNNATISDDVLIEVAPVQLGSGALKFTLTWEGATDLDLYVEEPSGTKIAYPKDCTTPSQNGQPASGCTFSPNGGALDIDDVDGNGPENIFYPNAVPDGTYCFGVRFFDESNNTQSTPFLIRVTANGALKSTEEGTLLEPSESSGYVLEKSGESYLFRLATPNDEPICPIEILPTS